MARAPNDPLPPLGPFSDGLSAPVLTQAALASVPADLIAEFKAGDKEYKAWGQAIITIAVFSIILTAPIGLIIINTLGPRWLSHDEVYAVQNPEPYANAPQAGAAADVPEKPEKEDPQVCVTKGPERLTTAGEGGCPPPPPRMCVRPMGTAAYGGKGQGKGKGRGEGRLGQGGRGRSKGGEKPMGTTAYGGKGSKGRAANGDRPVGAASCRRDRHTMASCQTPPPPPDPDFIVQQNEIYRRKLTWAIVGSQAFGFLTPRPPASLPLHPCARSRPSWVPQAPSQWTHKGLRPRSETDAAKPVREHKHPMSAHRS